MKTSQKKPQKKKNNNHQRHKAQNQDSKQTAPHNFPRHSQISLSLKSSWIFLWIYSVRKKWRQEWTGRSLQHQPELTPETESKTLPLSFPQVGFSSFHLGAVKFVHCALFSSYTSEPWHCLIWVLFFFFLVSF